MPEAYASSGFFQKQQAKSFKSTLFNRNKLKLQVKVAIYYILICIQSTCEISTLRRLNILQIKKQNKQRGKG